MDLIGSIKYIENSLAGRKYYHSKRKPARKNARASMSGEEQCAEKNEYFHKNDGSRLGRKIDTTA